MGSPSTTDLSINDEDQSATAAEDELRVKGRVEKVNLAGKVPDLETEAAGVGISKRRQQQNEFSRQENRDTDYRYVFGRRRDATSDT